MKSSIHYQVIEYVEILPPTPTNKNTDKMILIVVTVMFAAVLLLATILGWKYRQQRRAPAKMATYQVVIAGDIHESFSVKLSFHRSRQIVPYVILTDNVSTTDYETCMPYIAAKSRFKYVDGFLYKVIHIFLNEQIKDHHYSCINAVLGD